MLTCLPVDVTSWKIGGYSVLRSILLLPTLMKKKGVGTLPMLQCVVIQSFLKYRACQLVRKIELRIQWKYCLGHECLNQKMLSLHKNGIRRHRRLTELVKRHYNLS